MCAVFCWVWGEEGAGCFVWVEMELVFCVSMKLFLASMVVALLVQSVCLCLLMS